MSTDQLGNFEEIRDLSKVLAFNISGGRKIIAHMSEEFGEDGKLCFRSMGIYLVQEGSWYPIAMVDFESSENNQRGLNYLYATAYEFENDDPLYTHCPLRHRSIWITQEDGVYSVNVYDEDSQNQDRRLETRDIRTLKRAERVLEETIRLNPEFMWTRLYMPKK